MKAEDPLEKDNLEENQLKLTYSSVKQKSHNSNTEKFSNKKEKRRSFKSDSVEKLVKKNSDGYVEDKLEFSGRKTDERFEQYDIEKRRSESQRSHINQIADQIIQEPKIENRNLYLSPKRNNAIIPEIFKRKVSLDSQEKY